MMNNLLRYRYPIGKLNIFVNAGISNGFAISYRNYKKTLTYLYGETTIEEEPALKNMKDTDIGVILGGGFMYENFAFETRFGKYNGVSQYLSLGTNVKTVVMLLSYRF